MGGQFGATAYERRLGRLAAELAVPYLPRRLPADATQAEVIDVVAELNRSPAVSGILVLRPLPPQIDEATVFRCIRPEKDIEAVHPENAGLLALGVPRFVPSTAASAFHLLDTWLEDSGENRADFYRRSIDVGINPVTGPDGRVHMVGDVEFATVAERARAITPVPGGVGPVTDVWLLHNAVVAAHLRAGRPTADFELSFGDVTAGTATSVT